MSGELIVVAEMGFAGQMILGGELGVGLQQHRAHSRMAAVRPGRRAATRPCRLNVAAIAAPPRPPLSIPSVVPEQTFIDEVRSPPLLCRPLPAHMLACLQSFCQHFYKVSRTTF